MARGFAAAAGEAVGLFSGPDDYILALHDFRRALRRRFFREVTRGLPPDVVAHVMLVAVRMAVESLPDPHAAIHAQRVASLTIQAAERRTRDVR